MGKTKILKYIFVFLIGVILGGTVFSKSQPRSVFALTKCSNCLHPNEVTGLLVSAAIAHAPGYLPNVVYETEKSIAIVHPFSKLKQHYVIFPKKDIKNLGEIGEEDREYLLDVLAVSSKLIQEKNILNYKILSNGPKTQLISYLHFHLVEG